MVRDLFKKRVVELIHWLAYKEACRVEHVWCTKECHKENTKLLNQTCPICWYRWDQYWEIIDAIWNKVFYHYQPNDITIWRFLFALSKLYWPEFYENVIFSVDVWKLTKEDWSECTDDDQTDETIEKLYDLIK